MQFRVMGAIEVWEDGAPIPIGGRRQRRLLCSLLVARGSVVSIGRLAEEVWDDHDRPSNPEAAIRSAVRRLRRALGTGGDAIVTRAPGYVLEPGDREVDALRFEELVESGLAGGDGPPGERRLQEALALWQGPAFEEFADLDWCQAEAERLGTLRLVCSEALHRLRIRSGSAVEVIPDLERDCAAHPLHEPLWILLTEALWRAGRANEALRAANTYREGLAEATGLQASADLAELEASILAGQSPPEPIVTTPTSIFAIDHQDLAGEHRPPGPPGPPAPRSGNIPSPPSSFVGREGELIVLAGLLRDHRIVTVVGPGGVGKTRTAIEVCRGVAGTFVDGCWLVELASVPAGRTVWDPLAAGMRGLLPDATSFEAMVDELRDRRALILLDNCEHVIESTAEAVTRIAESCPGCVVLATSRQPLDLAGEHVFELDPLPAGSSDGEHSDAALLLVERAGQARLSIDDQNEAENVERVVGRLGGVPLAIELAAARLRTMTLTELDRGLDQQLVLLERRGRGNDDRHGSLATAIDWSYQLLSPTDRELLRQLSVFAGAFTETDVAIVVGGGQPTVDGIRRLVEHSLVQRSVTEHHSTFLLLDSVRQFAAGELLDPERADLERQHAEHYLTSAERCLDASGPISRDALDPLLVELRSALERSRQPENTALWTRLHRALVQAAQLCGRDDLEQGASRSALAIVELALDHDDLDIELLEVGARAAWLLGQLDTALEHAERWRDAVRGGLDPEPQIDALYVFGKISAFRWDTDRHREAVDELEALATTLDAADARAKAYAALANLRVNMFGVEQERAIQAADAAIRYATMAGLDGVRAQALVDKGTAVLGFDPAQGRPILEEGIRLAEQSRELVTLTRGLWNLTDALESPVELRQLTGRVEAAAASSGFRSMITRGGIWLRSVTAIGLADQPALEQQLSRDVGSYNLPVIMGLRCQLALESGDVEVAAELAAALEAQRDRSPLEAAVHSVCGLRLAAVRQDLTGVEELVGGLRAPIDVRFLAYINAAWALEELDRAGADHGLLRSLADSVEGVDTFQCRYLWAWSEEARNPEAAPAAYRIALDQASANGNVSYLASAHLALGRLALRGGQHHEASHQLAAALSHLERWPGRTRRDVEAMLAQTQHQPS